jgi:asparagine synthase (glutamine-hydrolysing)
MCGIIGAAGVRLEQTTLPKAVDLLQHRGPDDEGAVWLDEAVFLGHRRLTVIDLSAAGRQPMFNADGSLCLVYNGEVYNYRELRAQLCQRGHRFTSHTDTEVILHLYEEEHEEAFQALNGMFALALYDRKRQKLFLVRDRLGIKPLYYYQGHGQLAFGSEIKTILASGIYSPELNWQALYDYLTYLYVPLPATMFRDIFQVPPAHVLEFDLPTRNTRLWPYWQLKACTAPSERRATYEEDKRRLRELLVDSVQRQMISDVPLGIFLSGGIDSAILTGLMAQASTQPIKTFTVMFQGKDIQFYNESAGARAVAQAFGTEHHEIAVDIPDPTAMLKLIEFFDQPFGNPTFYLMYLISQQARTKATVALCGAGGDELFAGYPRYRALALGRWLQRVPYPLLDGARWLLNLPADSYRTMTLRRARQLLNGLDEDVARQFVNWTYFLNARDKAALLRANGQGDQYAHGSVLPSERIVRQYLDESPLPDIGNRMLHLDVQTFLVDNILEYTDKMSMAVGLEVRVPYLDHRIVEHSLAIPFGRKLRGKHSKIILRDAFADLLPPLSQKAPKRGFNAPLAVWMRDHLDSYFDRYMRREATAQQGIFAWEALQHLRHLHRTGKRDTSYELFAIIMFDVWYRTYLLGHAGVEAMLN